MVLRRGAGSYGKGDRGEEGSFAAFVLYALQISALVIANLLQPCQISKFQQREAIRGLQSPMMRL
jgi:hypothetical protein